MAGRKYENQRRALERLEKENVMLKQVVLGMGYIVMQAHEMIPFVKPSRFGAKRRLRALAEELQPAVDYYREISAPEVPEEQEEVVDDNQ